MGIDPAAPRRRNEPAFVALTAGWLAERRGDDPEALGAALITSYDRCFRAGGPS